MSTLSQFMPGGKPRQVTIYTSGSGTYTPVAPNSWCRVVLVGGGGSGAGGSVCYGTFYGQAGYAGQYLEQWTKVVSTAAYTVGNGGTWTSSGHHPYINWIQNAPGATSFNGITCNSGPQGQGGVGGSSQYYSTIAWSFGEYNHGSSRGRGGGGGVASNGNGCSAFAPGGNGTGGFIMIEDFGP